jgi:UDP-N-acetylmuramate--alanine ligase
MNPQRVHFIGIGGVGMSGLAEVLLSRGWFVSGSDQQASGITHRLQSMGAQITLGHSAENVLQSQPNLVVATAAVKPDNPERLAALEQGIEYLDRAEFLGRVMAEFAGPRIGITGTHGKTTTTAMTGELLTAAGADPTVLVGGEYRPFGSTARIGHSGALVVEACEAYNSFRHLAAPTQIAVITNIEFDHSDHYSTHQQLEAAFHYFAAQAETLVLGGDDPGTGALAQTLGAQKPTVTAGTGTHNMVSLTEDAEGLLLQTPQGTRRLTLNVAGEHNRRNAACACAASLAAGVPLNSLDLSAFRGVTRRLETVGTCRSITVIDDYAHHPTEVRATISTLRETLQGGRLVVAFQPHLYSRTRDFLPEFAKELSRSDVLLVTDIYPAREAPIPGVTSAEIVHLAAREHPSADILYIREKQRVAEALLEIVRPGDTVVTMGAGDIDRSGPQLLKLLEMQNVL